MTDKESIPVIRFKGFTDAWGDFEVLGVY